MQTLQPELLRTTLQFVPESPKMSQELESLDDIIKKKRIPNPLKKAGVRRTINKAGPGNKQMGPNRRAGSQGLRRIGNIRTNGITKGPRRGLVEDARTRIIQKNRLHLRDAREKLTKMVDARNKLRNNLMGMGRRSGDVNMGRRSSRMTLQTGKFPSRSMGSMNMGSRPTNFRAVVPRDTRYMDPQILGGYGNDYMMGQSSSSSLRRSVINDNYASLQSPPSLFNVKPTPYFDWDNPNNAAPRSSRLMDLDRPRDYKILSSASLSKPDPYRDDYYSTKPIRSIMTDDLVDKYYSMKPTVTSRSRVESPPKSSRPILHGTSRLKSTSSSSTSQGYRIVVSNLQANVTQEDIKELFEDIGELVVSRLVRPGIAEVVYKSLKDATKAVETYHNRQLDGHPMKCLLVNPKTKSSASSARSVLAGTRSNYSHQPSLGTVHRALFD